MLSTVSTSESLISIFPLLLSYISIENNTVKFSANTADRRVAFVLPSLANNDVIRELAIEDDVLDTLEDADFLQDWSSDSTGDHFVILMKDGEGKMNNENVIRTDECMAGDFTSAWTLALCQELAESVADGDGVVLGLHVVRLLVHVLQLRRHVSRLDDLDTVIFDPLDDRYDNFFLRTTSKQF